MLIDNLLNLNPIYQLTWRDYAIEPVPVEIFHCTICKLLKKTFYSFLSIKKQSIANGWRTPILNLCQSKKICKKYFTRPSSYGCVITLINYLRAYGLFFGKLVLLFWKNPAPRPKKTIATDSPLVTFTKRHWPF